MDAAKHFSKAQVGLPEGRGLISFSSLFYVSTELSSWDGQLFYMTQYSLFVPQLPVFSSVIKLGGGASKESAISSLHNWDRSLNLCGSKYPHL